MTVVCINGIIFLLWVYAIRTVHPLGYALFRKGSIVSEIDLNCFKFSSEKLAIFFASVFGSFGIAKMSLYNHDSWNRS